ncbi:MAG: 3-methyl-2-oxobutanoate hydroxymethyltransferase [Desulfovibrio sp.]|jgi:3-methyl-2-oxobutanoate hydroxymethyltransferase|nr:3-methyl-2-oxobutanoate hydroxymethyltransferase [Desulfovibrio sp.]MCR5169909.1 3-methyl-2-oxobutanoate hydroxymethyltransferase [Desulfovibrio sp.]
MKQTVATLAEMKKAGRKACMVTAYDYTMARLVSVAGADMILVGDSLGMVMMGLEDTVSVTMEDMIHHARAVSRGCQGPLLVVDMPFMSYQAGFEQAMLNAGRLMQEGRANAVKLEGGQEICAKVQAMVQAGIPVCGHVGLTPQSVNAFGGFHVQGRDQAKAQKLLDDARALDRAGCFAVVLECVPSELAKRVTESVSCLTIGIGAGPDCDGQVLVGQDLLAMYSDFKPKFVKHYAQVGELVKQGVGAYCDEVRRGVFPDVAHSFSMPQDIVDGLK